MKKRPRLKIKMESTFCFSFVSSLQFLFSNSSIYLHCTHCLEESEKNPLLCCLWCLSLIMFTFMSSSGLSSYTAGVEVWTSQEENISYSRDQNFDGSENVWGIDTTTCLWGEGGMSKVFSVEIWSLLLCQMQHDYK